MVEQFSRLVRVYPREVWANEASNFTPWLRDNIDYLAKAVGIEIQLVESEVAVGDFSVDLVGVEPGSSRPVIIENQLARTDHTHLGQLLTYAAGKNGGVIIWVSPEMRPEHRNALEWLNDATRGNLDFFGVELEVLQIEGSNLKAPNFKMVVGPKETPPTTLPFAQSMPPAGGSERGRRYQTFFQGLIDNIREQQPGITRQRKINFDSWVGIGTGRTGFGFSLAFTSGQRFRLEVYIDSGDKLINKRAFDILQVSKESIEKQLETELEWDRLDHRRACRISWYYSQSVGIMDGDDELEKLMVWSVPSFFKFREVMLPCIQVLEIGPSSDEFNNNSREEV